MIHETATAPEHPKAGRVPRRVTVVDFWRGVILLVIFVNHLPGNMLEHLTFRNLGFSDSAEAFVFLAGLSVCLAYYPVLLRSGIASVIKRCASRAFHIYRVHLALTFSVIALAAAVYLVTGASDILSFNGLATFFDNTPKGVTGMLTLGYQLGYLNILPLYVLLMIWAPVALLMLRVHVGLGVIVSLVIFLVSRQTGAALPSLPEAGGWFFNPFAWQFLFTLGMAAGVLWRDGKVPSSRALMLSAIVYLVASASVLTNLFGFIPGLWDATYASINFSKQDLALVRLLHFLLLAYLITQLPMTSLVAGSRAGRLFQMMGRHSLPIFVFGSFLSVAGQMLLLLLPDGYSAATIALVYTIIGAVCLFLLARYLEWNRRLRPVPRTDPPMEAPAGAAIAPLERAVPSLDLPLRSGSSQVQVPSPSP